MEDTELAERPGSPVGAEAPAAERYLLLADISGYTGFMAGVEQEHGVDFSAGIPAAYSVLGDLLGSVVEGVEPDFSLVKFEGDAVFAAAPAVALDGHGDEVLEKLGSMYGSFIDRRTKAIPANDHVCTACPAVAHLDLKVVLHRGHTVRQTIGGGSELLGPSVNLAHRLLKNTIRERIGFRPYIFVTDAAADALGLPEVGVSHQEIYADAGEIRAASWNSVGPDIPSEALFVGIGTIAVVVAGFAAIAPGLSSDGSGWTPGQRFRLRAIVSTSFNVTFESLLPAAIFPAMNDERATLVLASALVFPYALFVISFRARQLVRSGVPWVAWTRFVVAMGITATALFGLNALVFASVTAYALALCIQLSVAAMNFYSLAASEE